MKEYIPQRSNTRVIEPPRLIKPSSLRKRPARQRWWMILTCLLMAGLLAGAGGAAYHWHQRTLAMIDARDQQGLRQANDLQRWQRIANEHQTQRDEFESRLERELVSTRQLEQTHQATRLSLRELETRLAASEQQYKNCLAEVEASDKRFAHERDQHQQELHDLAEEAVRRLLSYGESVHSDPVLVRETLTAARQMASDHGVSGDVIDQRLQSLPARRLLPGGSSVTASDVTMEAGQIAATVVIQNANGEFIHDLRRGDIEVRSGSRRLHAVSFHETRRTASRHEIAVLLDVSGSTTGVAHTTVKTAASQFVRTLANPNRLRVWMFADAVEPISSWSIDAQLHEQAIAKLTAGGGTALYQAVKIAADSLSERHGTRAIVLFTDGKDSGNGESIDATLELCRQRSIPVHVVMLETQETNEPLLRRIATATGGTFHRAANPSQLADQFREVALRFMQPCYRLQIHESVGTGPLTLQIGDLPVVPLPAQP